MVGDLFARLAKGEKLSPGEIRELQEGMNNLELLTRRPVLGGDMTKQAYDPDLDGKVESADQADEATHATSADSADAAKWLDLPASAGENAIILRRTGRKTLCFIPASDSDGLLYVVQSTLADGITWDWTKYFAFNANTGQIYSPVTGTMWGSSNDGSGSGLDADLLDGAQPDAASSANTIVKRDANKYIYAEYFNSAGIGDPGQAMTKKVGLIAGSTFLYAFPLEYQRRYHSQTQTINRITWTQLMFDTQVFGINPNYNAGYFYAGSAGYYTCEANVGVAAAQVENVRWSLVIQHNQTYYVGAMDIHPKVSTDFNIHVSTGPFYMAAGDNVRALIYHASAAASKQVSAASAINQQFCSFSMTRAEG